MPFPWWSIRRCSFYSPTLWCKLTWVLRQRQELNRGVWEYTRQLLSPSLEVVAVYYRQRFCLLTLAEFGRILLDITDPARAKLREKLRRIERQQYSLLENARPP